MHRYLASIQTAMEEIQKTLDTLSPKDVSPTGVSARQLVDKWLNHILKVVNALIKEMKSPETSDLARAEAERASLNSEKSTGVQQEMSSMAAGSGSGPSGGIDLGSDEEVLDEEDQEYLKEGTLELRKVIRESLSSLYKTSKDVNFAKLVEQFGLNAPASDQRPQADTGGELAKTLFPQIKTIVQKQYTMLKTNDAQRHAFTKQLMKALEVGVNKLQVDFDVAMQGGGAAMQTDIGDKNEEDAFNMAIDIPNLDPTGKGFALVVYKSVFPKIQTALNGEPPQFGLTDASDRRSFVKTIVDMTKELLTSLEKHMAQVNKPPAPPPAQAVAAQPPVKTNANSDFLLP